MNLHPHLLQPVTPSSPDVTIYQFTDTQIAFFLLALILIYPRIPGYLSSWASLISPFLHIPPHVFSWAFPSHEDTSQVSSN